MEVKPNRTVAIKVQRFDAFVFLEITVFFRLSVRNLGICRCSGLARVLYLVDGNSIEERGLTEVFTQTEAVIMNNEYGTKTDETFNSPEKSTNDEVISCLNGLIETCKDGQDGFKTAAEGVERSDLKSLFYEFGQQRSQFAGELQSLVQDLGGDPENTGTIGASLHRGWINIKSVVTGKDDTAILNECERGEDSAKKSYKTALDATLPANVREVVNTQYTSVQAAHDRVKALRDSSGDTASNSATTSY